MPQLLVVGFDLHGLASMHKSSLSRFDVPYALHPGGTGLHRRLPRPHGTQVTSANSVPKAHARYSAGNGGEAAAGKQASAPRYLGAATTRTAACHS